MHFVVFAKDRPDALHQRLDVIDLHRAYLGEAPARQGVKVLLSGPLTEDDGETMCGSFFLLDAPDRTRIEQLFADDPLKAADVWETVEISAVHVRQNNMNGT
ncbi:YciI family protein [Roseibium sp. MMSF_3412]|uniref:YciI family protein n=1 Tax=Roseibium sp. MMSF_3412 TaxID=3046712 RepID=UPI00273D5EEE|nr:YciI family protein [Roseibium sp. MMSF_3412]